MDDFSSFNMNFTLLAITVNLCDSVFISNDK